MTLPRAAAQVLRAGTLCYVAATTPDGPHVTPVVFVLDGDEVWATTARGTAKVKAWRGDDRGAGLVSDGRRWVSFRGRVRLYDLLDPSTWRSSLTRAPRLTRASVRFTLKNARFFGGYARDAHRVPLAWTPPGRVLVSIRPTHGAVIEDGAATRWGRWPRAALAHRGPGSEPGRPPEPPEGMGMGDHGAGVLGASAAGAPVLVPVSWRRESGGYRVEAEPGLLASLGVAEGPAALVIDRASGWRASRMRGLLLQGPAGAEGADALLLRPVRLVWWKGWASGSVAAS